MRAQAQRICAAAFSVYRPIALPRAAAFLSTPARQRIHRLCRRSAAPDGMELKAEPDWLRKPPRRPEPQSVCQAPTRSRHRSSFSLRESFAFPTRLVFETPFRHRDRSAACSQPAGPVSRSRPRVSWPDANGQRNPPLFRPARRFDSFCLENPTVPTRPRNSAPKKFLLGSEGPI